MNNAIKLQMEQQLEKEVKTINGIYGSGDNVYFKTTLNGFNPNNALELEVGVYIQGEKLYRFTFIYSSKLHILSVNQAWLTLNEEKAMHLNEHEFVVILGTIKIQKEFEKIYHAALRLERENKIFNSLYRLDREATITLITPAGGEHEIYIGCEVDEGNGNYYIEVYTHSKHDHENTATCNIILDAEGNVKEKEYSYAVGVYKELIEEELAIIMPKVEAIFSINK